MGRKRATPEPSQGEFLGSGFVNRRVRASGRRRRPLVLTRGPVRHTRASADRVDLLNAADKLDTLVQNLHLWTLLRLTWTTVTARLAGSLASSASSLRQQHWRSAFENTRAEVLEA